MILETYCVDNNMSASSSRREEGTTVNPGSPKRRVSTEALFLLGGIIDNLVKEAFSIIYCG